MNLPSRVSSVGGGLAALAAGVVLFATATAHAQACFPACRSGYVCAPDGKCVSECNPPCEGGKECRARECVVPSGSPAATAATSSQPADGAAPSQGGGGGAGSGRRGQERQESEDDDEDRKFVVLGGFGGVIGERSAPALTIAARYQLGDDHAFVLGPRAFLVLPSDADSFGIVGIDVGYRGLFGRGKVRPGLLAVGQPQIYAGGGTALLHLGVAVGPLLRIGRFELELPLSIGRVGPTKDPFGSSRLNAAIFTVSLLGGVAF